jgi:hypothetical protein
MTNEHGHEHELELQQLFAEVRRPIEDDGFTLHVLERLQYEHARRARRRRVVVAVALSIAAFAIPWAVREASVMAKDIVVPLASSSMSEGIVEWLPGLLLSVTAFAFAGIRRLMRDL